jgi:hypothetical protein
MAIFDGSAFVIFFTCSRRYIDISCSFSSLKGSFYGAGYDGCSTTTLPLAEYDTHMLGYYFMMCFRSMLESLCFLVLVMDDLCTYLFVSRFIWAFVRGYCRKIGLLFQYFFLTFILIGGNRNLGLVFE